ncbi:hypothetical protein F5148DRAFT_1168527 [Russula earlei]|uniref:Uncharacterized protein n=1 Tax=Russula earlei TaxID=71964 RepID=A0ACC0UL12_9AGAM|nr:hypothetical protein F5148DRAFT_1168527 [Russula earlei]
MLDPWSDFAGKLSLDALVVAMQQATLFARSDDSNDSEDFDYLPRRPSSLPDKYRQSLIDPLVRITGMFQDWLDRHSKPSSALNPTSTPVTSPLPTTPPSTPSTPSPTPTTLSPSAPLSSSQVPSTPSDTPTGNPSGSETSPNVTASVSSSSGPSYPSTTSTPSSPVKQSSDSESNAVLESSPSNSLSSTHHGISKSILAVIVVFTLFIFFALVLAAIAFCVHRARRSASPSLKSDDEQMNYDRRDPNPPVVTVIPEMQTSRPLSDISVYSEPHSFAPRNADTHHVDRPVITPLRLDSSLPTPELGGGGMAAQSFSAELQPPSSQWAYEYEASSDDGSPRTTNRPLPATPPTAPLSFRRRD